MATEEDAARIAQIEAQTAQAKALAALTGNRHILLFVSDFEFLLANRATTAQALAKAEQERDEARAERDEIYKAAKNVTRWKPVLDVVFNVWEPWLIADRPELERPICDIVEAYDNVASAPKPFDVDTTALLGME